MKIEFSRNNEQEKGFKELLGRFDEAERLMKPSAGQTALSDLDRLQTHSGAASRHSAGWTASSASRWSAA